MENNILTVDDLILMASKGELDVSSKALSVLNDLSFLEVDEEDLLQTKSLSKVAVSEDGQVLEYFGEELSIKERILRLLNDISAEDLIKVIKSIDGFSEAHLVLRQILINFYKQYEFKTRKEMKVLNIVNKVAFNTTDGEMTPPSELIPNFLVENTQTIIISVRGGGKTTLTSDIIVACETGGELLGGKFKASKPMKTLTVICEGLRSDIPTKIKRYAPDLKATLIDVEGIELPMIQNVLKHFIEVEKVEVVIFDSYTILAEELTNNINDNNQVMRILKETSDFVLKLGASVILNLHASMKGDSVTAMGASAFEKKAGHIYRMSRVEDVEGNFKGTKLMHTKNRYGDQQPTEYYTLDINGRPIISEEIKGLALTKNNGDTPKQTPEEIKAQALKKKEDLLILEWNKLATKHEKVTHGIFAKHIGQDTSNFTKYIKDCLHLFEVEELPGRGKPKAYILKE